MGGAPPPFWFGDRTTKSTPSVRRTRRSWENVGASVDGGMTLGKSRQRQEKKQERGFGGEFGKEGGRRRLVVVAVVLVRVIAIALGASPLLLTHWIGSSALRHRHCGHRQRRYGNRIFSHSPSEEAVCRRDGGRASSVETSPEFFRSISGHSGNIEMISLVLCLGRAPVILIIHRLALAEVPPS